MLNETEKVNMKMLVADLRENGHLQGRGKLRLNDRFCCLGRACEISNIGTWKKYEDRLAYTTPFQPVATAQFTQVLPADVIFFYGFDSQDGFQMWMPWRDVDDWALRLVHYLGFKHSLP